jgi:hypothetical protein
VQELRLECGLNLFLDLGFKALEILAPAPGIDGLRIDAEMIGDLAPGFTLEVDQP